MALPRTIPRPKSFVYRRRGTGFGMGRPARIIFGDLLDVFEVLRYLCVSFDIFCYLLVAYFIDRLEDWGFVPRSFMFLVRLG